MDPKREGQMELKGILTNGILTIKRYINQCMDLYRFI